MSDQAAFRNALLAAEAARQAARGQALIDHPPIVPSNWQAYASAIAAADLAFNTAVTAAAAVDGITVTRLGSSS